MIKMEKILRKDLDLLFKIYNKNKDHHKDPEKFTAMLLHLIMIRRYERLFNDLRSINPIIEWCCKCKDKRDHDKHCWHKY